MSLFSRYRSSTQNASKQKDRHDKLSSLATTLSSPLDSNKSHSSSHHEPSPILLFLFFACIIAVSLLPFQIVFQENETDKQSNLVRKRNEQGKGDTKTKIHINEGAVGKLLQISRNSLTGYHTFTNTFLCELSSKEGVPSSPISVTDQPPRREPCVVYYPSIELKNYMEKEEASSVTMSNLFSAMNWSLDDDESNGSKSDGQIGLVENSDENNDNSRTSSLKKLTQEMKLSPPAITHQSSHNEWDNNDRAILTRCGYKGGPVNHQVNQDRALILSPYYIRSADTATKDNTHVEPNTDGNDFLMGIFDGHGDYGHAVSHYVAMEMPKILSRNMQWYSPKSSSSTDTERQRIVQSLKDTFLQLDESIPSKSNKISDNSGQNQNLSEDITLSGCTCSILLRLSTKLYVANAGDSKTLIAAHIRSTNSTVILYQSREDKPHLKEERERIEKMGGEIILPQVVEVPSGFLDFMSSGITGKSSETVMTSSRVIVPISPSAQVALAMSRSIGDHEAKSVGVISEPLVDILDLEELLNSAKASTVGSNDHQLRQEHQQRRTLEDQKELQKMQILGKASGHGNVNNIEFFSVAASDGLYDQVSPIEVVQYLAQSLYYHNNDGNKDHANSDGKQNETDERTSRQFFKPPRLLQACENLIRKSSELWIKNGVPYRDDITIAVNKIQV